MNLPRVDFGKFAKILDIKRFINVRILTIVLIVVSVLSLLGFATYASISKSITISDNETTTQVKTTKRIVKDILAQKGFAIAKEDIVIPDLDESISDGQTITIKRATPVKLVVGGVEKNILTNKQTVGEVLDEQQVVMGENSRLNFEFDQQIIKDLIIRITNLRTEEVTEKVAIAYKVNERQSTAISRGSRRIVRNGIEGTKEVVYKVTYEDNNIVSKESISERVTSKPVNAVVEVGTEPRVEVTRGGAELRYSKVLTMNASAYTAGFESTGKRPGDRGYGRTATGMTAKRGVVAVDPRVIPLGTKLYIQGNNGCPDYGYAVAADKGSAIKGNKIDLFYDSLYDAKRFGRRNVTVYVLE